MVKIVFVGGLANGRIVYNYLKNNKHVSLVLGITYPDSAPKPDFVNFPDDPILIKDESANKHLDKIREADPEFIFVAGWSELLKPELFQCARKGTIGFHPSRLPNDRGRSVLAWQIEEGYQQTALSMFYYNHIPDGGDIIGQDTITIDFEDTIKDVLRKVSDSTLNLMRAYFPLIREGKAPRSKQDINQGNFRRLRGEKDLEIDWNRNSLFIYNKVRALTNPYPGTTASIQNERFRIWKCEIVNFPFGDHLTPGTLVATMFDQSFIVRTRNGFVRINQYERL